MKWENSKNCEVGSTKNDLPEESNSKLSVALSVMHECFEPVKNLFSNRDLVDDVVFNSRERNAEGRNRVSRGDCCRVSIKNQERDFLAVNRSSLKALMMTRQVSSFE